MFSLNIIVVINNNPKAKKEFFKNGLYATLHTIYDSNTYSHSRCSHSRIKRDKKVIK